MAKKSDKELKKVATRHFFPQEIALTGCPTKEQKAHNDMVKSYLADYRKATNQAQMGEDIFNWILTDIHTSFNPANMGKAEVIEIENPDFDNSKKPSKDNPLTIQVYRHMYDPARYKENTAREVAKEAIRKRDDYIKMCQEHEKQEQILAARELRESEDVGESGGDEVSSVGAETKPSSIIDGDWLN